MKRLRRLQLFVTTFLAAQLVVGYLGWLTPSHEIFPFASWLLFSVVPDHVTDYDLVLRGSFREPQEPPRSFNRASNLVKGVHSVASYQLIQQLGEAVEARNSFQAESVRRQIEEQFYTSGVRYDLIRVTFQPVERWKTGRVLSSHLVESFVSGEARPPVSPSPSPRT